MPSFISTVVGVKDAAGNRVDAPNADGSYNPIHIQIGTGISATATPNGGSTDVVLTATNELGSTVLITHSDSPYTVPAGVYHVEVDTGEGAIEITLIDALRQVLFSDAAGHCDVNPATIFPPADQTIKGDASWDLDVAWASAVFTHGSTGSSNWSVVVSR
jgi:hypothetical protein